MPTKARRLATDENLKRLLSLRVLNISGQIIATFTAVYYLDFSLPIKPLLAILICLIAWSIFTLFFLKQSRRIDDNVFFLQLSIDVAALAAILYFTGGATNPFAWFLLVPHSIASTLLSRRYVWLMALLTSLSYTLIVFYYRPLVHLDHPMEMGVGGHFADHVIGMWIGFVLATILMAHFVAGMAEALRTRNDALLRMKERIFRDERLVSLATLATGAAHELGTPLGTMDILAHEMKLEIEESGSSALGDKLSVIQGQIKRCKKVLLSITRTVNTEQYGSGQLVRVDEYIESVIAQWRISNVNANFNQAINAKSPPPSIISNVALTRALVNILDNAAQASPDCINLTVAWSDKRLELVVEDIGSGMDDSQLQKLGQQLVASTKEGLGMGVYLTKATIEQLGGSIHWVNKDTQGVRVSISVPLSI
ncbi:MAG: histidine kinase [Cycloclasticus sp. symbiont of Poecilosclerida sp. N]|nr:MAG: histidine kinase [Cycloclasticus sp. symbiont of Poecilosclerida sp. N]